MKKWIASVTYEQITDTKEEHATASAYMLHCKPGSAKILPYNTAHKWGGLFQVLHVLNKGINTDISMGKNVKELPRKP